jgi:hypothetical protein
VLNVSEIERQNKQQSFPLSLYINMRKEIMVSEREGEEGEEKENREIYYLMKVYRLIVV